MKNTVIYLIASLLLTGCTTRGITITVSNSLPVERKSETVEIAVADITSRIENVDLSKVKVVDSQGKEIASQLIYEGEASPVKLIFQVNVPSEGESTYTVKTGRPAKYVYQAYGRFVPERMDDYAWENNRIAFRIYGTALIKKDGPSNGLDVWVKRTNDTIINKWYREYLAGKNSYHDDNGTGCDCFKVGRTLGAGAMAPFVNDSLWLGINFVSWKTLDNGPIRTSFMLNYQPFEVNGKSVTETRLFSLDAGSQLNLITETYSGIDTPFTVAAGIAERPEGKIVSKEPGKGYIAYSLNDSKNGTLYVGTVIPQGVTGVTESDNHLLIEELYTPGTSLSYYSGAGWSKWGFENDEAWLGYLDSFILRLHNPLKITIK
ncbi:MAG TPA: DUF4861 family protein [Bacteroidales bacterium]|nr:DUF4861 family protein [Bacteroidales bacterium]